MAQLTISHRQTTYLYLPCLRGTTYNMKDFYDTF